MFIIVSLFLIIPLLSFYSFVLPVSITLQIPRVVVIDTPIIHSLYA
jgi:hypothetical protein